jgi:[methyl-Co(III) glycine betaine-specific corrinoid protein]---tetrahydrofolate methyltransferase
MFKFEAEQKVYNIGGVELGGQPGEWPTALILSIFYKGDKNVIDEMEGTFDQKSALDCIQLAQNFAQKTGTPIIIDIVAASEKAMVNYIDFITDATTFPFVLDGTLESIRIAGARRAAELGLQDRCIYDSINLHTREREIDQLKELGLPATLVMIINERKPTLAGRLEVAPELIDKALNAGFEKLLLDTAVLDVVEPGPAGKAIFELKNRYGYPSGCSPTHTHRHRWKKRLEFGELGERTAKTSTATAMQVLGADFIMYGIKQPEIIPAMGMVDALIAFTAMQYGVQPKTRQHPLYKMFMSN